jgi:hypothetical protein
MEHFLGLINPTNTSAINLKNEIEFFFKERGIDSSKLLSITSDSASNLYGVNNGLIMEMIKSNPKIIGVACVAHRFNSFVKECMKKTKLFEECEKRIAEVIDYFNSSPSKLTKLKNIQKRIYGKEICLTTKCEIHWASLGASVRSYRNSLLPILEYFFGCEGGEGIKLAESVCNANHIKLTVCLDEILNPICFTWDALQRSKITIIQALQEIENLASKIEGFVKKVNEVENELLKQWEDYSIYVGAYSQDNIIENSVRLFHECFVASINERCEIQKQKINFSFQKKRFGNSNSLHFLN